MSATHQTDRDAWEKVLHFWLGTLGDNGELAPGVFERWWKKDSAFDAQIQEQFGDLVVEARKGELDHWTQTARGSLGLIVLCDQFSRNIFRGTAESYAADEKARAVVKEVLSSEQYLTLRDFERYFVLMPLMHAEDIALQNECVARFEEESTRCQEHAREVWVNGIDFAEQHRKIVARFGRFPHRNAILGRTSTPEEEAFLREPGSSF